MNMKNKQKYDIEHAEAHKWLLEYQHGNRDIAYKHLEDYIRRAIIQGISDYYIGGMDKKDIYQEALLSILPHLNTIVIDNEKGCLFSLIVVMSKRHIITKIQLENALKRRTINNSISLSYSKDDSDELISYVTYDEENKREKTKSMLSEQFLENLLLSPLEDKVYREWRFGDNTYYDIAHKLNITEKIVDNTLSRVKHKMINYIKLNNITKEDMENKYGFNWD